MENKFELKTVWKGTDFWTKEIEKAGELSNLKFFNDVITENRPPHPDSGYGAPVLIDFVLDSKKVDIYHADKDDHDHFHRIFLHIKEIS